MLALVIFASLRFSVATAQEPVFSGPQVGESLTPFRTLGFSGAAAGQEQELLADPKSPATLLIFVHQPSRPLLQLLRPVDRYAMELKEKGLEAHVVWLDADRTNAENFLRRAERSLALQMPISISLDGLEGPGSYGLNRSMAVTIVIAKGDKVTANFAIVQPNETDAPKVITALAETVGVPPPAADEIRRLVARPVGRREEMRPGGGEGQDAANQFRQLREDLMADREAQRVTQARLEERVRRLESQLAAALAALNEARAALAKIEGRPAPEDLHPAPEGRPSNDAVLQGLMRQMIQRENDASIADGIAGEMRVWAGEDTVRQQELADYCQFVLLLGYGNETSREALRRLAETRTTAK
jgi:hypothetical protein